MSGTAELCSQILPSLIILQHYKILKGYTANDGIKPNEIKIEEAFSKKLFSACFRTQGGSDLNVIDLTDSRRPKLLAIDFLPSCRPEAIVEKSSHTPGFQPEGLRRDSLISMRRTRETACAHHSSCRSWTSAHRRAQGQCACLALTISHSLNSP